MFKDKIKTILGELNAVLVEIKEEEVAVLANNLISSKKIVVIGSGRMGLAAKAFAMRLMHLGKESYTLNDCNLPSIGSGDVLLLCSGSGETQTIYDLALIAKNKGVKLITITGNLDSRMAKFSDFVVQVKAPSKASTAIVKPSIQPMTSLMEQSLFLFFDALVLELMEKMNINSEQMKSKHSVLE